MPMTASFEVQEVLDIPVETPATVSKKSENYVSAFPEYQSLRGPEFKNPSSAAGLRRASIVWFRNDLRLHDNEALVSASRDSLSILPVYCFDPRDYGNSSLGIDKNGPYRVKFLFECVANLRSSLRERGSDLIVRIGKPEEVLLDLAKSVGAESLYAHQEVAYGELQEGDFVAISSNSYTPWLSHKGVAVKRSWNALNRGPFQAQEKVAAAFQDNGVETKFFWGGTLVHLEDLPFELDDMPSNYGGFREMVQNLAVRSTIEALQELKGLPACGNIEPGRIPFLQELGLNPAADMRQEIQTSGGAVLMGGEDEALKKLDRYVLETSSSIAKNKQSETSADSLYGANFSCKISPWLALGCLSPRRMFEDLKKSRSSAGVMPTLPVNTLGTGNEDHRLNWVLFELLWRDFFRFITKKYGTEEKFREYSNCSQNCFSGCSLT